MDFGNIAFWMFLATVTVASLAFVSVLVWVEARRKERQDLSQSKMRRQLIEAGKIDSAALASVVRYEHDLKTRRIRQKLIVAAFIFLGTGVGTCFGLQFVGESIWQLGYIPVGIGLSMLAGGLLFAAKPQLDTPPQGWFAEPAHKK